MRKNASVRATLTCALIAAVLTILAARAEARGSAAGAGIPELDTTRVANSLSMPLFVTAPPGDFNRAFIVEQRITGTSTGRIRILDLTTSPPTLQSTASPYFTVSPVSTGDEQGLLGLAFHPDFLNNGYFWVYYTNPSTQIVRYQANAPFATSTTANLASATTVLSFSQPFSNHNGGWIGFGPDGFLYIASGDGGSANDPGNRAQNIDLLLGKMLRIDVDGADNIPGNDDDDGAIGQNLAPYTNPPSNPFVGVAGLDQIWAYGLRNPWRASFDRLTGDLFIADVGQNVWEEIDFQPASSIGGENYGWRCMEGNHCTGLTGCTCQIGCGSGVLECPIYEYSHGSGCSITGGYVYRGSAIPSLQGTYFFADYCSAQIWTFSYSQGSGVTNFMNRTGELAPGGGLSINSITSFGEDAAGEIYICDRGSTTAQTGEVFKLIPGPPANNNCINATLITDGSYPFSNVAATTDGPDEPAACTFNGYSHVESDVWYQYLAPCTGTARVSLCGANFNTKVAVYGNTCPTGPGSVIACNDDFCGTASEVTFPVVMNSVYRIRIGGVNGATGSGTMVVNCDDAQPCPADIDASGSVDVTDLLAVINSWGPCPGCPADTDNSGTVDVVDLLAVINGWGPCP